VATTAEPRFIVGRERELVAVEDWLRGFADGPVALGLTGEPGIGKTTVWAAALVAGRSVAATVLTARPVQSELQLGFAALGDLLAPVIDQVLPELPPPLASALGAALLRVDSDHRADPHAVARGLVEALLVIAQAGPLVVAVDDLQWLDPASAKALAFAVRRLGPGTGLVTTLRLGEQDPLEMRAALGDRLIELHVGPLSVGAVHDLLRRNDSSVSRRDALRVHGTAGGNPFYAMELARSGAQPHLPLSLRAIVETRLTSSSKPARAAVEAGAVLGPAAIDDVLRFDDVDARSIDEATTAGVMVVEEGELRFSHPLLAAGALAAIPPVRRRELHRHAADIAGVAEDRARHVALATGGKDAAAATLLERAAGTAHTRGAPESAINLIGHAVRLTGPGELLAVTRRKVIKADLLYLAGADSDALVLVDEVLASGVAGPVRARALIHRVQHDSDPATAVERLEEAVQAAGEDDVLRARALATLAWMRGVWGGDVDGATAEAELAVALAVRTGDASVATTALTTAGTLHALSGDASSVAYFGRAVEAADGMEWVAGDRSPFVAFAHQRFWRADWVEADALLKTEQTHAVRNGEESRLERLNIFRADLEIRRCRWGEAERLLESALAWAGTDYWRARALLWRALLLARRGDRAALTDVTEAATSLAAQADPLLAATAAYAGGLVALADQRPVDAAAQLRPLPERLTACGLRELSILLVAPDAVEALVDAGETEAAVVMTDDLASRAVASDHPLGLPAADRCRGLISLAGGELEVATARLRQSRDGFAEAGVPYDAARTELILGSALRRAGKRTAAAEAFTTASAVFVELGASRWRERADQELLRVRGRSGGPTELTAAERRVARLVASGSTNREVAAQLYTTVATVEAHLTRIYRKRQFRSRTELVRAAADGRLSLD